LKHAISRVAGTIVLATSLLGSSQLVADEASRDAWLQSARLGPYAPAAENWDEIAKAAANEPPLLVYMSTSRIDAILELFREKYPDVKVEGLYNRQQELLERVAREYESGLSEIGVVEFAGAQTADLLPEGSYVTYVPGDVAALYPESYKEPFQYASFYYGWGYNPKVSPGGSPIKSLWDLTTEEFRGKVIIEDILRSSDSQQQLANIVARADELAADYQASYGKPLELTEADAGFEWLRRLLENEPTIVGAWREVADILHANPEPMVGGLNFARMSEVAAGNYDLGFSFDVTPVDGVEISRWVGINTYTQSPNAAKLFVRELIDGPVSAPILENGFSSPKEGWSTEVEWMAPITNITSWPIDVDYMNNRSFEVIDFWMLHAPQG
jgi:iron(III) transport system substrate-binding protein